MEVLEVGEETAKGIRALAKRRMVSIPMCLWDMLCLAGRYYTFEEAKREPISHEARIKELEEKMEIRKGWSESHEKRLGETAEWVKKTDRRLEAVTEALEAVNGRIERHIGDVHAYDPERLKEDALNRARRCKGPAHPLWEVLEAALMEQVRLESRIRELEGDSRVEKLESQFRILEDRVRIVENRESLKTTFSVGWQDRIRELEKKVQELEGKKDG